MEHLFNARLFNQKNTIEFEYIFNKYISKLYWSAIGKVNSKEVAEDIVSESFIKLWNSENAFAGENDILYFLLHITKNSCLNFLRQNAMHERKDKEYFKLFEKNDEIILKNDGRLTLLEAIYHEIENLPNHCRNIFKLAYIEGMGNKEIADKMNMRESSIKNAKHRASIILRKKFKNFDFYL